MKYISTFLILLLLPTSVHAQSFSFQMAPQLHEIITKRDKTVVLPYSLTNIGDSQLMTVSVYTIHVKDNEGNYDIKPYTPTSDAISFKALGGTIELDKPILIRSNETADFDIEVTIPPSIKEADYAFSIVAETETQRGFSNSSGILLQGGIASNILLTVTDTGDINSKGHIVQYDILSPKAVTFRGEKYYLFDSNELIPVFLTVANKGTNYTKVSGSLTLISQFAGNKSNSPSITIHPQYVLAGSQRTLKTSSDSVCETTDALICKKNNTLILKAPTLGIYKLAAVVSFGESSQIGYGNVTFISFPFTYTALGILTVLVLTFLIVKIRKRALR